MKRSTPKPTKQWLALNKIIKEYWKEFRHAELKHDFISANLKIYSDTKTYVCFYPREETDFCELSMQRGDIIFSAKDISEESFSRAIRFIRKEMKNKIIIPSDKTKFVIADLKEEIKTKRQKLKDMQSNNTK